MEMFHFNGKDMPSVHVYYYFYITVNLYSPSFFNAMYCFIYLVAIDKQIFYFVRKHRIIFFALSYFSRVKAPKGAPQVVAEGKFVQKAKIDLT